MINVGKGKGKKNVSSLTSGPKEGLDCTSASQGGRKKKGERRSPQMKETRATTVKEKGKKKMLTP